MSRDTVLSTRSRVRSVARAPLFDRAPPSPSAPNRGGRLAGLRWLPAVGVAAYWALVAVLGGGRLDHLVVGLVVLALFHGGRPARSVGILLLPVFLTGAAYDAQRYLHRVFRGEIRVRGPYQVDLALFGVATPEGRMTLPEWFQLHTHPALDVVAGVTYLGFIPVFVVTVLYFATVGGRRGSATRSAAEIRVRVVRVTWALFWVNVAGYVTHAAVPTAPPWYVAEYGFGPAVVDAAPEAAGAARFDSALGTSSFEAFYGKSVNTFGAVPSLHVAWSTVALYWSFRFGMLRFLSSAVLAALCWAALYLNHHYVLDVVAGLLYGVLGAALVDGIGERRLRRVGDRTQAEGSP